MSEFTEEASPIFTETPSVPDPLVVKESEASQNFRLGVFIFIILLVVYICTTPKSVDDELFSPVPKLKNNQVSGRTVVVYNVKTPGLVPVSGIQIDSPINERLRLSYDRLSGILDLTKELPITAVKIVADDSRKKDWAALKDLKVMIRNSGGQKVWTSDYLLVGKKNVVQVI